MSGNATIHMTPPDIKIGKILCIRKDWNEELVELIKARFVREKRKGKKKEDKLPLLYLGEL